jgi:hypothetical protein
VAAAAPPAEAGADDDDRVLALVGRVDELERELEAVGLSQIVELKRPRAARLLGALMTTRFAGARRRRRCS